MIYLQYSFYIKSAKRTFTVLPTLLMPKYTNWRKKTECCEQLKIFSWGSRTIIIVTETWKLPSR